MSATSKRLHEGNRKRPLEESGSFSFPTKLIHPADNKFCLPSESQQDGHVPMIQRIDPRDVDRRSSLLHRRSSSPSNYLSPSVQVIIEHRSEYISTKGSNVKAETRETIRELYANPRSDYQGSRIDKYARLDRTDDEEIRPDRVAHSYFKGDSKCEKDSYVTEDYRASSNEAKGHHRDNKYSEPSTSGLDRQGVARDGLMNPTLFAKNLSTAEKTSSLASDVAVGADTPDNHRAKAMHRKDEKLDEFGQRDKDQNDCNNKLQVGLAIREYHEPLKEDTQWRERGRIVIQIDKEHYDKMDLDQCVPSNANERKGTDGCVRIPDREVIALQQQQESDRSCTLSDKDINGTGRGADVDKEYGECADGDTGRNEKVFDSDVQQHRTMPELPETSEGPPDEGSQGQSGVAPVVYEPGICKEELLKSWREFEASQDRKLDERYQSGPVLEIQIPAEYVTATNPQVHNAQLWGKDTYTNDSDIVAVLMHTGYCRLIRSPCPTTFELHATVQVLPPQDWYAAATRNKIRSRAWGRCDGCSFRIDRCCIVKKDGGTNDLEPHLTGEPTLAPVLVECTKTTRASASNAQHSHKFLSEVTIQYNLCNEPWVKYGINIVADKGTRKSFYTAARLKKGEVLYLETYLNRYELCFNGDRVVPNGITTSSSEHQSHSLHVTNCERNMKKCKPTIDVFRWSRCKKPLPQKTMCSIGIPLQTEHLEVLEQNLEWEDIQWSETGVWVAGTEYVLARAHFLSLI